MYGGMKTLREHPIAAGLVEMVRRIPLELRKPIAAVLVSGLVLAAVSPMLPAVAEETLVKGAEKPVAGVASDSIAGGDVAKKVAEKAAAEIAGKPTAAPANKPAGTTAAAPDAKPAKGPRSEVVGFYVNWDETSYQSLAKNIETLTIVMPEWYHVGGNGRLVPINPEKHGRVLDLIKQKNPDVRVMPIVNNFGGETDPKMVGKLIAKPAMRKRLAEDIVRTMKARGYHGVNIDFEGLTSADRNNLVAFMRTLYPLAKKADIEVSQDVLASSATYDYKNLAASADYLIPMMYDEHWKTSPSGPVASQGWYDGALKKFISQVPASKVVIAMGTYGYDWSGGPRAKATTYPKAIAMARSSKQPIKLDPGSLNSTFWYESGGRKHRVWMLDAMSAFNQVKSASKYEPRGYAIWRLGGEDPGLWNVLANRDKLDADVAKSLAGGKRWVQYDAKRGLIVGQRTTP